MRRATNSAIIAAILLLLLPAMSMAETNYIYFAKSLLAKDYDDNLPPVPIEQWLHSTLPNDVITVWGQYITGCGEQTGNPAIDKNRDMPLCAEIELINDEKTIGYLLLFIGTQNKGVLKKDARLYLGYIKANNKELLLNKLSELVEIQDLTSHPTH